jgi:putative membrane protein
VSAGIAVVSLALIVASEFSQAQNTGTSTSNLASSELAAVDYNFVAQANLGAAFQIDSGCVAEVKAKRIAIRNYAHATVAAQIQVAAALNKILQEKHIKAPRRTLLVGAYQAMIASLRAERRGALDRDYVADQVDYQRGNAALFHNEIERGYDQELRQFVLANLPEVEGDLQRALTLPKDNKPGKAATQ